MRVIWSLVASILLVCGAGCGGEHKHSKSRAESAKKTVAKAEPAAKRSADEPADPGDCDRHSDDCDAPPASALPTNCDQELRACYPPLEFVRRLCRGRYPGVAMVMFEKSAPWQHGYVKVKDVNVVNPLGGPIAKVGLGFTEEVVLLRRRGQATGKMQISAAASYFVLRFDGTCATLAADEFSRSRLYPTRHAPVAWLHIDGNIRQILSQNRRVDKARHVQMEECHGLSLGVASAECQKATKRLTQAIMAELNSGVDLPTPRKLPEWSP